MGGDAQRPVHRRRLRRAEEFATLWREVATELADSLRKDASEVRIEDGPWGREVVGAAPAGVVRFIGVDGYRWMIRCVVNGPQETIEALSGEAREALADTVVRRGDTPLPVRTPLPVQLPEPMAEQLRAAAEQSRRPAGRPTAATAAATAAAARCAPQRARVGDAAAAHHHRRLALIPIASGLTRRAGRPRTPRRAPTGRRPSRRA